MSLKSSHQLHNKGLISFFFCFVSFEPEKRQPVQRLAFESIFDGSGKCTGSDSASAIDHSGIPAMLMRKFVFRDAGGRQIAISFHDSPLGILLKAIIQQSLVHLPVRRLINRAMAAAPMAKVAAQPKMFEARRFVLFCMICLLLLTNMTMKSNKGETMPFKIAA